MDGCRSVAGEGGRSVQASKGGWRRSRVKRLEGQSNNPAFDQQEYVKKGEIRRIASAASYSLARKERVSKGRPSYIFLV